MQFGQLRVRCGPYTILIPGENVGAIDPAADLAPLDVSVRIARRHGFTLVLDARRLLDLDPRPQGAPRVNIHWHSLDDTSRAVLAVDGVDGLRYSDTDDLLALPRVPARMRRLFAGVVADGDGKFLLQLRRDVSPRLDSRAARLRFARAISGALPPSHSALQGGS
jgi:hypothetical protein